MNFFKKVATNIESSIDNAFSHHATTEFEPELVSLMQKSDDIRTHTEKLINALQKFSQGDTVFGMKLDDKSRSEVIANRMNEYASAIGKWDKPSKDFQAALDGGSDCFNRIARAEKALYTDVETKCTGPAMAFINNDVKAVDMAKKQLYARRTEMDSLKAKLAKTPENEVMKVDLEKAQKAFDEQKEKVKEMILGLEKKLPEIQSLVKVYIDAYKTFAKEQEDALDKYSGNLSSDCKIS